MDDSNRHHQRRHQNEPPLQTPANPRYSEQNVPSHALQPQQRPGAMGASTERYRPSPLNTAPPSSRAGTTGAYGGYYQEQGGSFSGAMSQGSMSYQSEYSQDARQTHGFGGYNTNMMYSVPPAGGQGPVYDGSLFPARQPASSSQMMPPDVSSSYAGFDSGGTSHSTLPSQQPHGSSSAAGSVYPQNQLQSYQQNMPAMSNLPQTTPSADVSMEDQEYAGSSAVDEKWEEYQTQLRTVFQDIRSGALDPASDGLLTISNFILTGFVELGLHLDNEELFADRMKLWHDFNHAWLGLFQQQKDMMESGQQPQRSQSLLSKSTLEKMGKELVRLCDGIERHGLVDYEYGVLEEEIILILSECLELYDAQEAAAEAGGPSGSQGAAGGQH